MKHNIHLSPWFSKILILSLTLNSLFIQAQTFPEGEYVIMNKSSSRVLDVKSGNTAPKTPIWQYNLNLTNAQYFRLIPVESTDSIFRIQSILSNLFLTVKYILNQGLPGDGSGNSNSNYYVMQDVEYVSTSHFPESLAGVDKTNQYWRLVPVQGEESTFVITSVRYFNQALRPVNNESKSGLRLEAYAETSIKKWIFKAIPKKVTNVSVSGFSWKVPLNRITGKIKWKDNSDNEEGFEIWVYRKEGNSMLNRWKVATAPANTTEYNFTFDYTYSVEGRNKEHCFNIRSKNKWESLFSKPDVCAVALFRPPPPAPQ